MERCNGQSKQALAKDYSTWTYNIGLTYSSHAGCLQNLTQAPLHSEQSVAGLDIESTGSVLNTLYFLQCGLLKQLKTNTAPK